MISYILHKGAVVLNHVSAVSLLKDKEGKVVGAVVRNNETGEEMTVRAKVVVNATGPFVGTRFAFIRICFYYEALLELFVFIVPLMLHACLYMSPPKFLRISILPFSPEQRRPHSIDGRRVAQALCHPLCWRSRARLSSLFPDVQICLLLTVVL